MQSFISVPPVKTPPPHVRMSCAGFVKIVILFIKITPMGVAARCSHSFLFHREDPHVRVNCAGSVGEVVTLFMTINP